MKPERRRGRRPGDPGRTRQDILDAARDRFGAVGFDRATIRSVAESAGVDPALVIHHFGSKRALFVAAHELPLDPAEMLTSVVAAPLAERGEMITRAYLEVLAAPGSPVLGLLRTAATNDEAARMLREFIQSALLDHAGELIGGPDAELRMALISSHLIGVVVARDMVGIGVLGETSVEDLVAVVSPTIQFCLEAGSVDRAGSVRS